MATLTVAIDSTILEAAQREAARRRITLDQLVADTLATMPNELPPDRYDNTELVRLMKQGPLGDLGKLPTREEIYAERSWPRP